jgi:hypothetical protein
LALDPEDPVAAAPQWDRAEQHHPAAKLMVVKARKSDAVADGEAAELARSTVLS